MVAAFEELIAPCLRVYLDPKEPTFLGFLIAVSSYKSLKS